MSRPTARLRDPLGNDVVLLRHDEWCPKHLGTGLCECELELAEGNA